MYFSPVTVPEAKHSHDALPAARTLPEMGLLESLIAVRQDRAHQ
jgi:hypothetical protein